MRKAIAMMFILFGILFAHGSYTGGYSGSPGKQICASSCHGGTSGTMTVTGFPSVYTPLQAYTITIKHNGGNTLYNFNATTRIGTTSTIAGTFTAKTNCALYTGTDGGVYANIHNIDSAVFIWTAPAKGSGAVFFYAAGYQGTNTSGQTKSYTLSASETTTGVDNNSTIVQEYKLLQNYPNPFNPSTFIRYQLPEYCHVLLKVYDMQGKEITTLINRYQKAGSYDVEFNSKTAGNYSELNSGVYFYRLTTGSFTSTKKLILLK